DIAGHVAGTLGSVSFGRIRVGREHQPHMKPHDLLKFLWPGLVKVMQLPPPGSVKEPPLDPIHWPIIAGIVAAAFITKSKDTLDPRIAFTILMEAGVIASKFDPATIDPGKWRLETHNGSLLVFRANA
ncbi:MAG TPA: hypothetical protein VHX39_13870, partial [Acetobacteraceae bacterium]|nr:hypothetical protein [Acetobacteraceae bacterium]